MRAQSYSGHHRKLYTLFNQSIIMKGKKPEANHSELKLEEEIIIFKVDCDNVKCKIILWLYSYPLEYSSQSESVWKVTISSFSCFLVWIGKRWQTTSNPSTGLMYKLSTSRMYYVVVSNNNINLIKLAMQKVEAL